MNLSAYFDRIGWGGGTSPTLENLSGILEAHIKTVPFENFSVLLAMPMSLDLEFLEDKIVRQKRGGYCFEQVTLFSAVLEQLGFDLVRHTARVVFVNPIEQSPRTHMIVKVRFGSAEYVVDPGLGGPAPLFPVPIVPFGDLPDHEPTHYLTEENGFWVLKMKRGEEYHNAWVTTFDADQPVDFEVGHHYTSTHPGSVFVNRVMLRAHSDAGVVTVMNQDAAFTKDGRRVEQKLASRRELRELVQAHFGFDLPGIESMVVPSVPEWSG